VKSADKSYSQDIFHNFNFFSPIIEGSYLWKKMLADKWNISFNQALDFLLRYLKHNAINIPVKKSARPLPKMNTMSFT
jgi:hypothetical protein